MRPNSSFQRHDRPTRVIVVGAGIAGLTLAVALRSRGHEPVIIERSPRLRDEGYMEAAPEPPALHSDDVAQVELPTWNPNRVALVGDAGQAVSLLAGQGASIATAAAWVLAEEIHSRRDLDAAFAAYERRVRPAVIRKQAAGRSVARWFVPEDHLHLLGRDLAMRMSVWSITSGWVRHTLDASAIA